MKNGLNSSKNEVYTIRRKLFEMFLEIINWWTIEKFCGVIICGLHFDKTLRINYQKYIHICNYYKHWSFKGMKKCNKEAV